MDTSAGRANALAANEKEKLSKEGRCFRCKKQGHISCNCPDKEKEAKNKPRHENYRMTTRAAEAEGSGQQGKVEELAGGIRELGDEEKEGLLDLLMEKGF
jgi:hypothetical protein